VSDPELEEIPYILEEEVTAPAPPKKSSLPVIFYEPEKEVALVEDDEPPVDVPVEGENDPPPQYSKDPTETKAWVKQRWWKKVNTLAELTELTGVPKATLENWIYGISLKDRENGGFRKQKGWAAERDAQIEKKLKKVITDDSNRINLLIHKMLSILEESTKKFADTNEVLSLEQYTMFINAFEKLFKTRQLILGNPTEIYGQGTSQITWEQVLEKLRKVDIIEYKHLGKVVEVTSNGQRPDTAADS